MSNYKKAGRVFVVQDVTERDPISGGFRGRYDFTPAGAFGEIVVLLSGTARAFRTDPHGRQVVPPDVVDELRAKLSDVSENDYLLLLGHPILTATAAMIASENCTPLSFLQWSGKESRYMVVRGPSLD